MARRPCRYLQRLPFSMGRQRRVWASCIVYGLMIAQLYCASYYRPIYFRGVKGVSPLLSVVHLLPGILVQFFSSVVSEMLAE